MSKPIDTVITALEQADCKPLKSGRGWSAKCPAHDDRNPSLSVGVGADGRALLTCHAGCSLDAIVSALGLTQRDLFECGSTSRANGRTAYRATSSWQTLDAAIADLSRTRGALSASWTYRDSTGDSVGAVLRWNLDSGKKEILPLARISDGWTFKAMPSPRPLYNLAEVMSADRVFVCEGEKAADAVISCGLVATTSAGGSNAAAKTDWAVLAGKDVVILPDNDDAGEKYAEDVVDYAFDASARSVRIVRLLDTWSDMPTGSDFDDMVDADGPWSCWDDEDIQAAVDSLVSKFERLTPDNPQKFEPFPVDALPEPVRSYVASGAESIGCDASYIALPMLSALASAIGDSRAILLKNGWTEPAILWTAIVGESGTQKTPAFKLAARAVRIRQRRLMKEHAEAMKRWESDDALFEIALANWKKDAAKSATPPEPPEAPEKPICPRAWIEDCTTEKLASLLQENPRGLLMLRNELSGWFSFGQYKSGGGGDDVARWLQMFDADELIVDRKGSGTSYVPRAAVSIAGGIQPEALRRAIGQEHRDNGMLARLLLTCPPRRAKRWTEAEVDPLLAGDVEVLFDRLYELEPDEDKDGDPTPRLVRLNRKAKAKWIAFVNKHGQEQVEHVGDEAAAWSKLEGYAARFALVIHLTRSAANDPALADAEKVDEASIDAGVVLARWFAQEALRVYSTLAEDDEARERRHMLERIEGAGGSVSVREWQRIRSHRKSADAKTELDALVETGFGAWQEAAPGPKGGRPSRRFVLAGQPRPSDTTPNTAQQGGPVGQRAGVSSVLSVSEAGAGES